MRPILELYGVTGHMAPIVEQTIFHLATSDMLPDESGYETFTEDDLADALLRLHGIVCGSGSAPVGPAVDFDLTDAWSLADSRETSLWNPGSTTGEVDAPTQTDDLKEPRLVEHTASDLPSWEPSEEISDARVRPARKRYEETVSRLRAAMRSGAIPDQDRESGDTESWDRSRAPEVATAATTEARIAYPSDVTDTEWGRIESLVPQIKPGGRPGKYQRREILNGILYQTATGCPWRGLPHDLPPWKIVHHYFSTWRKEGVWTPIVDTLFRDDRDSADTETASDAWATGDGWRGSAGLKQMGVGIEVGVP